MHRRQRVQDVAREQARTSLAWKLAMWFVAGPATCCSTRIRPSARRRLVHPADRAAARRRRRIPPRQLAGRRRRAFDCPATFPPVTCAYQIRLSATARVTDGYSYIGYTEATTHVTFMRTGAALAPVELAAPFGMSATELQQLEPAAGTT